MAADPSGVSIDLVPWGVLLLGLGAYLVIAAALIAAGRRDDARAIAGFIPDCVVMVSRLARDPAISRTRRALLFVVLAYLALPIDLIPDFLPVAGQLDDAVVLALGLRVLAHGADAARLRAAWPGPESSLRLVLFAAGRDVNGPGSDARARL